MSREDKQFNRKEHQDKENDMNSKQEDEKTSRRRIRKIDLTEAEAQEAFAKLLPWL